MSYTETTMLTRFAFLKILGSDLVAPYLRRRITEFANLPQDLKQMIKKFKEDDPSYVRRQNI